MPSATVGGSQKRQLCPEDTSEDPGHVLTNMETKLDRPAKSHVTHQTAHCTGENKTAKFAISGPDKTLLWLVGAERSPAKPKSHSNGHEQDGAGDDQQM
jgi:hypothetical protein